MNPDNTNPSYLFGVFCASLQQMQEVAHPEFEKKGINWASDALVLFRTNPMSTLQLIEENLRKFPREITENNVVYLVSDLIQLYQRVDFENFTQAEVDEEQFVLGYRSKIFDTVAEEEGIPLVQEEDNPQEFRDNPNFLLGMLIAKVQFMDEGTDKNVEKKGDHFVEDVFSLFSVNMESTLQLMDIIIKKLPESSTIGHTTITLQEIILLYGFLGRENLLSLKLEQNLIFKGYHEEMNRLSK